MKKGTKIALLIAAVMIAVGATLCNIARGRGESLGALAANGGLSFSAGSFDMGDQRGYTVCLTGEESFDAAEVRELDIGWLSGSVRVETCEGKRILLREESPRELAEAQRLRWKLSDGRLSVLFCANRERSMPDKALTLLVPRDWIAGKIAVEATSADVELSGLSLRGALDVETTSGGISVLSCGAASLDLESSSGNILAEAAVADGELIAEATSGRAEIRGSACRELKLEATSGDVSAERTTVNDKAKAATSSGSVTLTGLPGGCRADVETTSGDVTLRFDGKPGEINVETSSGDVTLSVPRGTELDMDYDSASGQLSGELHFTPKGVKVRVETSSGDLLIEGN